MDFQLKFTFYVIIVLVLKLFGADLTVWGEATRPAFRENVSLLFISQYEDIGETNNLASCLVINFVLFDHKMRL